MATSGSELMPDSYGLAPLGGVERPGHKVRFARLMPRPAAFLPDLRPRRLRRQSECCIVSIQGGMRVEGMQPPV